VFEYFLGQFALAEGKKGGQFYTPRSVVELLVEMLEPYRGRVFDPCCGSGGMFVQSEKFVQEHQGRINDISIYGQESNQTTWRLCKMNLAIRGIDATQVKWNPEGSFLNDACYCQSTL
jgi:type I restriction enzyme M protein